MKNAGYLFLFCILLNLAAWGQSAHPVQLSVVMKCAGLSCNASGLMRNAPDVKLGSFKAYPHSGLHSAKREVRVGSFRSAPVHSVLRPADNEVKLGTFKSLPTTFVHPAVGQSPRLQNGEKTETLFEESSVFALSALVVQR
jgi:hypothetical protein